MMYNHKNTKLSVYLKFSLQHSKIIDTYTRNNGRLWSILVIDHIIGALLTINHAFTYDICGISLLVIIRL